MGTLYLIRHGAPDWPEGERVCLGRKDLPLAREGRFQAGLLKLWFQDKPVTAVTSPLSRCRETAEIAFGGAETVPDLTELDMGAWDGLSFADIRARYPEEYRLRGLDPIHALPPGGEAPRSALCRMEHALLSSLSRTAGDTAAVSHAGVIRLLLCKGSGRPLCDAFTLPQPHGCVNVLTLSAGGVQVVQEALRPAPMLNAAACRALLLAVGCPTELSAHCKAVAEAAMDWTRRLKAAGLALDSDTVQAAALLHDMARGLPRHGEEAGRWLRTAGYEEIARAVERHHDWVGGRIDEAAVVFLADKLVQGARRVTLEERFETSRKKCVTPEALAAHERRYQAARGLLERVQAICGEKG